MSPVFCAVHSALVGASALGSHASRGGGRFREIGATLHIRATLLTGCGARVQSMEFKRGHGVAFEAEFSIVTDMAKLLDLLHQWIDRLNVAVRLATSRKLSPKLHLNKQNNFRVRTSEWNDNRFAASNAAIVPCPIGLVVQHHTNPRFTLRLHPACPKMTGSVA